MRETDKSSARHVVRVVVRLIWGLVRDGITERQHRLAGRLAGIAFALTVVPGIQSILGVQFGGVLGAAVALASVILGGLVGGWAAGLGEQRVP